MDFKWLLITVLLIFGAILYFNEDLRGLGGASSGSESELERLNSEPSPAKHRGDEPSTPR